MYVDGAILRPLTLTQKAKIGERENVLDGASNFK